jgi:hypothetical protein
MERRPEAASRRAAAIMEGPLKKRQIEEQP